MSGLKDLVIKNYKLGAKALVEQIIDFVYIFGNQRKWKDDATVVVVKRLEKN